MRWQSSRAFPRISSSVPSGRPPGAFTPGPGVYRFRLPDLCCKRGEVSCFAGDLFLLSGGDGGLRRGDEVGHCRLIGGTLSWGPLSPSGVGSPPGRGYAEFAQGIARSAPAKHDLNISVDVAPAPKRVTPSTENNSDGAE